VRSSVVPNRVGGERVEGGRQQRQQRVGRWGESSPAECPANPRGTQQGNHRYAEITRCVLRPAVSLRARCVPPKRAALSEGMMMLRGMAQRYGERERQTDAVVKPVSQRYAVQVATSLSSGRLRVLPLSFMSHGTPQRIRRKDGVTRESPVGTAPQLLCQSRCARLVCCLCQAEAS